MTHVLVTGVNGFVGQHLCRELKKRGCEVIGVGREAALAPSLHDHAIDYHVCDLVDPVQVSKLPLTQVDAVISLAGLARVGDSFADPALYARINVNVATTLAAQLVSKRLNPRFIAISTGAVYDPRQPLPLTETSRLSSDGSPYAMSKIMMEVKLRPFNKQGLAVIIVRPFNHLGPGQDSGFLLPDLNNKIKRSTHSGQAVKVGNLTTKRDYTDVRDVVRAYADLALAPALQHDLYNVCSGRSRAGQTVLEILLGTLNLPNALKVETDPALVRPDDPPDLYGSYERLHKETGWQPIIPLEQTIKDFVKNLQ